MAVTLPPSQPVPGTASFNDDVLAFFSWFQTATPQFNNLAILADGGTYQVQSTPIDLTADRIAQVGSFGLGSPIAVNGAGNDYDETTGYSGFLSVPSLTGTNKALDSPTINSRTFGWQSGNDNRGAQFVVSEDNDAWLRAYDVGPVFDDWTLLFSQSNCLGTVSQASGVPTGRLIEEGSTANGSFTKFADGTLICSHKLLSAASAAVTWTYPHAFDAAPAVLATPNGVTIQSFATLNVPTTTNVDVYTWDETADGGVTPVVQLVAIGRWF